MAEKSTPHEARMRATLDRQTSLQDRVTNLRDSIASEPGNRNLSPSQRDAIANDTVAEYQKTEIIRQSIQNVQRSAEEQKAKRDRRTTEIKSPSKIKQNMKTQKKAKAMNATIEANKAGLRTTLGDQLGEAGVAKLFQDLDVTYERLGVLPRRADISPQRQS